MTDITQILSQMEDGDSSAAEQLLPLVYDELRKLATAKLANEKPGQTLQATALVHDAYLRLIEDGSNKQWDGRGHFFSAAAEAMRRILVDRARSKKTAKRGGDFKEADIDVALLHSEQRTDDLLALDEALERLEEIDQTKSELVKLRYFAGLTIPQAAAVLGIAPSTADKYWAFAKAWLRTEMERE